MYVIDWTVVWLCVGLEIVNLIAFWIWCSLRAGKKEEPGRPAAWSLDLEQVKSYFGKIYISGDVAGFHRELDDLIEWAYEGERHIHKNPYTVTPRPERRG